MMRGMGFGGSRGAATPATVGLMAAMALFYVLAWLGLRGTLMPLLAFNPAEGFGRPWTMLTYPFASAGAGNDLFWFLLGLLWLWFMGSDVEREQGSQRFLLLFFVLTLIGALSWIIGGLVTREGAPLAGPFIPVSAVTMIWASRNPQAQVRMMGIIPLTGQILGWLTLALVLFGAGAVSPLMGVFALAAPLLGYLFGSGRLGPVGYSPAPAGRSRTEKKREDFRHWQNMEEVKKREQERDERERLRKLFESSLSDDEKNP